MKKFGLPVMILLVSWLAQAASAGGHGSSCAVDCGKTCRLVCETRTIKVTCYACECQDICIPGRSCEGCVHEDHGPCNADATCDGCSQGPDCHVVYKDWSPGECAEVKTRKVLVKYEATKQVPSFKWVVEDCCKAAAPASTPAPKAGMGNPMANSATVSQQIPVSYQEPVRQQAPVSTQTENNSSIWSLFR